MRKILLLSVLALLAFSPAVSADDYSGAASEGARDTVESDVGATMENARRTYDQMGEATFDETIPRPEDIQTAASQCLDGILSADFGLGLNVPSISNLFNRACGNINSEIRGHMSNANMNLSDRYSEIGIGFGGSRGPRNRINYDQRGGDIADDLWHQIDGDSSW